MAMNGASQNPDWKQLIEFSKRLSCANKVKLNYEHILRELTVFQNLTDLVKGVQSNKLLESIFSFSIQVVSDPTQTGSCVGENALIKVENISEVFTFSREYWYFSVDVNCGASATIWRFEKDFLKPGDTETFLVKFVPNFTRTGNIPAQDIKISLILCIAFDDQQFQRIFDGAKVFVDVLHLLCPGKRPPYSEFAFSLPEFPLESERSINLRTAPKCPPIVEFKIKLDKSLSDKFPSLFLSDCLHRGFDSLIASENSTGFHAFYEGDKIIANRLKDFGWSIVCSTNTKLLILIKASLFKRILNVDGLKIEGLDNEHCEKLCKLRLKLESCGVDLERGDFQEMFLLLREVSEQILFCL